MKIARKRAAAVTSREDEGVLRRVVLRMNDIRPGVVCARAGAFLNSAQQKKECVMANIITDETIDYVGILAKLELSPEEKERAKKDMAEMLDYIDQLNELDTSGVEPMSHVFPVQNVFREDEVRNGDQREKVLSNAPEEHEGQFVVPRTVE